MNDRASTFDKKHSDICDWWIRISHSFRGWVGAPSTTTENRRIDFVADCKLVMERLSATKPFG